MLETYRDIAINFQGITVDCQVPVTVLVGHYFKNTFKETHMDFFNKRAK